jgi:phospholipid-transporting ATPase
MSLDGETNLKWKVCGLPEDVNWQEVLERGYRIDFEQPSAELYEFKGALVQGSPEGLHGMGVSSLLLRGSALQHTEWIVGLVVYCGHDTRVMRNQQGARFKQSQLDVEMNRIMVLIFGLMLFLCATGGFAYTVWEALYADDQWYMMFGDQRRQPLALFAIKSGTWALQLANMVPISLLVTITSVKFIQGKLIAMDESCKDQVRGTPAEVHTSQVLESLGQITHVFSDKTGTLTCNEMVYKACYVNRVAYGVEDSSGARAKTGRDRSVDFDGTDQFLQAINSAEGQNAAITSANFLLCHALCHTVTLMNDPKDPSSSSREGPRAYAAESPDELALVSAAREIGLEFAEGWQTEYVLRVTESKLKRAIEAACGSSGEGSNGGTLRMKLLAMCEFDNDRKRMSVVVRYPNGKIILLVKGADSAMLSYIEHDEKPHLERVLTESFAKRGLRTLCLGMRELTKEEFERWSKRYQAAESSIADDKIEQLHRLACELEESDGMHLLGATAIEDRLQNGVPDTIEHLRNVGIVVWVLTGDKMETAINIGKSCRLLTDKMANLEIQGTESQIREALQPHEGQIQDQDQADHTDGQALTITGQALAIVLRDEGLRRLFYKFCEGCQAVLCCRVSPKQKADVVQLAKSLHEEMTNVTPVTLAIGDGANDVSMITAAHVGVGLSGKEGAQAARAADFAFAEFRFLERLLFTHGHESYRRNAVLVNYNFYKNLVLVLPPFLFGPMMSFSGQPFYEQKLYQLYNVVFTSLPIVAYAVLDRPAKGLDSLATDIKQYIPGRRKEYFNRLVFLLWAIAAVLQSLWLTFAAFAAMGDAGGLWPTGSVIFAWVVLGVNLTIGRQLNWIFPFSAVAILGSVLAHPVCLFMLEAAGTNEIQGTTKVFLSGRYAVATMLFAGGFVLIGELVLMIREKQLSTSSSDDSGPKQPTVQRQDTQGSATSSTLVRRGSKGYTTSSHTGFAMDKDCAKSTNHSKERRQSVNHFANSNNNQVAGSDCERGGVTDPLLPTST